jgi:hypothetical protein
MAGAAGGGKNGSEFLNDVFVLEMETLGWVPRKCTGDVPLPRAYHTMTTCYPKEFQGEVSLGFSSLGF